MYFRFMDDATFGRSGPDGDTWRVHAAATTMSGVATGDTGAESDVYECLVLIGKLFLNY